MYIDRQLPQLPWPTDLLRKIFLVYTPIMMVLQAIKGGGVWAIRGGKRFWGF
jgi:hypothetical protein